MIQGERPKVGIGVYILNKDKQLLLMLRKNVTGAGTWCPPGGHLEYGEEFEDCAKREVREEVGLNVEEVKMWAVNNNIMTEPPRHYVNVDFLATKWSGSERNMEPEKCEQLKWFDLNNLPEKLLEPTKNFFKNNPFCPCESGLKYFQCHGKN